MREAEGARVASDVAEGVRTLLPARLMSTPPSSAWPHSHRLTPVAQPSPRGRWEIGSGLAEGVQGASSAVLICSIRWPSSLLLGRTAKGGSGGGTSSVAERVVSLGSPDTPLPTVPSSLRCLCHISTPPPVARLWRERGGRDPSSSAAGLTVIPPIGLFLRREPLFRS